MVLFLSLISIFINFTKKNGIIIKKSKQAVVYFVTLIKDYT